MSKHLGGISGKPIRRSVYSTLESGYVAGEEEDDERPVEVEPMLPGGIEPEPEKEILQREYADEDNEVPVLLPGGRNAEEED